MQENNFDNIVQSVGLSIKNILDRPPLAMLKQVVEPLKIETFLAERLLNLKAMVNLDQRLNIQAHQIPVIAESLIERYPVETLEDFVLCFKRGSTGVYGTIYRLDASVITEWMNAYLEEKYGLVEATVSEVKKDPDSQIDYKGYLARLESERVRTQEESRHRLEEEKKRQLKELDFDQVKQGFKPMSPEELKEWHIMAELRRQYSLECYDKFGRLKEGSPSFEDWIKQ